MDDQLNQAPCGYLSLTDDSTILEINKTLLTLLQIEMDGLIGEHINSILTASSRIFYQIYFFPLIRLNGKVDEMYLSLRSRNGQDLPILLNAVRSERSGVIVNDCIIVPMRRRIEYEQKIHAAENMSNQVTAELKRLEKTLESKKTELVELNLKLEQLTKRD
jgi:sigma-B regulation protein RsbU (phosphoserine phosphatase)